MFKELENINVRPKLYELYTARELWTDEYTSEQMLKYHLDKDVDISSRNAEFVNKSVEWIVSEFDVGTNTKIADFGCGPGLYTEKFARKQAKVTGIDFSKRSIEYAEKIASKEGLSINYINQDYLEFETNLRFNMITMIMCDFCALNPTQRKNLLNKFYKYLEPGGYVLLDVYSLSAFNQRKETTIYEVNLLNGFWSPKKYHGFLNTFKYEDEKVVLDKYVIIELNRTRTIYNWLRYFTTDNLSQEFMESGFIIDKFYSDVAGSPFDIESAEFAVVAKKV